MWCMSSKGCSGSGIVGISRVALHEFPAHVQLHASNCLARPVCKLHWEPQILKISTKSQPRKLFDINLCALAATERPRAERQRMSLKSAGVGLEPLSTLIRTLSLSLSLSRSLSLSLSRSPTLSLPLSLCLSRLCLLSPGCACGEDTEHLQEPIPSRTKTAQAQKSTKKRKKAHKRQGFCSKATQKSTKKHKEAQRSTNKHKNTQTSTKKHKEAQTSTEIHKEAQTSTKIHKQAQTSTHIPCTQSIRISGFFAMMTPEHSLRHLPPVCIYGWEYVYVCVCYCRSAPGPAHKRGDCGWRWCSCCRCP